MRLRERRIGPAFLGALLSFALVACGTSTSDNPSADPTPVAANKTPGSTTPDREPSATVSTGVPKSLDIDSIGVSAPIIPVGLNADGSQEVPKSVDDIGWWKNGSEPAEAGNAVFVGHTFSRGDGVFDNLDELRKGETITVKGSTGTADFVVENTKTVPVQEFGDIADEIYRTSGESELVLMTCGDFDGKDYGSTVIVQSHLVPGSVVTDKAEE